MKRFIVALLLLTTVSSTFTGCTPKEVPSPAASEPEQTKSSDVEPEEKENEPEEKIEITWLGISNSDNSSASEGTYPELLLEEQFNIEIKPIFMDVKAYTDKLPIMLSSGEIPDLLYLMDPSAVQSYASNGFLAEVPYDLILEKAPNYAETINEYCSGTWLYPYYEGKNYGIPNLNWGGDSPKVGMWRMDWLNNVGIDKVPETLDEMYEALYLFSHNDPNKSGAKDTYGMTGDVTNWHMIFTEIFGAYGVLPFNWIIKDDEIVYGADLPETKEALMLLNQWYADGLIHPDFITDNLFQTETKNRFTNGEIGYIPHYAAWNCTDLSSPNSQLSVMKQINPEAEIAIAPQPTGPNGDRGTFAWGLGGHIITFGMQVTDQPEKMNKILEILEYQTMNEDFSLKVRCGEEGTHYNVDPSDGRFKNITPYDDKNARDNECLKAAPLLSFYGIAAPTKELFYKFYPDEQKQYIENYANPKWSYQDAFLKPDAVPSAGTYFEDLKLKQQMIFAQIIRGEKTMDDYENFMNDWHKNGGDIMLKDANELNSVLESIYKEVGL